MWKSLKMAVQMAVAACSISASTLYGISNTWTGSGLATPSITPATSDLQNPLNWVGGLPSDIPGTLPTDVATFPTGMTGTNIPSLQSTETSVLSGYSFTAPIGVAPPYTFNFMTGSSLVFTDLGATGGIQNTTDNIQIFNVYDASIIFQGSSSITGDVIFNLSGNSDAYITFQGFSNAGGATTTFNLTDNATLNFQENSNPGAVGINLTNGTVNFTEANGPTYTGAISGTGTININLKDQVNTLTFDGSNSHQNDNYFGSINIIEGTLMDSLAFIYPEYADVNISLPGILSVNNSQTINSLSGSGLVTIVNDNPLIPVTLTIQGINDTVFSGLISTLGPTTTDTLTLSGQGSLTLTGSNSYSGVTTLTEQTTLRAGSNNVFSSASNVIIEGLGATLDLNGYDNTIGTLDGLFGSFVSLGSGTLSLSITDNTSHVFNGTMYGTGGLIISGSAETPIAARFTLGNSFGTIYSGQTWVQGISFMGATTTLAAGNNNTLSPYSDILLGRGNGSAVTTLSVGGFDNTVGSVSGDSAAKVSLGTGGKLTLAKDTNAVFAGAITGADGSIIKQGAGIFTLRGSGLNTYSGRTFIQQGTIQAGAINAFSAASDVETAPGTTLDLNNFNNTIASLSGPGLVNLGTGTLTTGTTFNTLFDGTIQGTGGLTLQGTGNFTIAGPNTYKGTTTIFSGTLTSLDGSLPSVSNVVDNGILVLDQQGDFSTVGGSISGSGSVVKTGNGAVLLSGNNTYLGGTTVTAGQLIGSTKSLQGNITDNADLVFNQEIDGIFNGALVGTGTAYKQGKGRLSIVNNSPLFQGTTVVDNGTLSLNALLGGNAIVNAFGRISGTGTVGGNLAINRGGVIAPGNSIGTLNVLGNYVHNDDAIYVVQINSSGQSSLINVAGSATLNGGEVLVEPIGGFDINADYLILDAAGGVTGTFDGVCGEAEIGPCTPFFPVLVYTPTQVFLEIEAGLLNVASTRNEQAVAFQLDSILNPDPKLPAIVNQLINLSPNEVCFALSHLTGEQLSADLITTEINNRQFIRRLYDPLRPIVTTIPCTNNRDCIPCYDYGYDDFYDWDWDRCNNCKIDGWFEGSGVFSCISNRHHVYGFKTSGYELTGGVQGTMNAWTLGIAGSYAQDTIDYHRGGHGKADTYFAGLYGLYRPEGYYVLSDLTYGYTNNRVHRHIHFGTLDFHARSRPNIQQVSFYAEAGKDFCLWETLIQPFFGFEVDGFWRDSFREHGADGLDLFVHNKSRATAYSRLGVHFKNPLIWDIDLTVDVAWDCRWSSLNNHNRQRFAAFGDDFCISGIPVCRNSIDGSVALTKNFDDCWSVYLEFTGQAWSHISNYNAIGGVEARW